MRFESLAVSVQPRSGWQAIDLGFRIARQWWRPLWTVWFALYLPVALLLALLLRERLWYATLLLWWLKPLFDRALMHVVSQAVFGVPPALRDTLRNARQWLRPGCVGTLLWRRADLARSMMLPVVQLEGQRGRAARARRKVLGRRMRGYAVWLTVVCAHFEWLLLYGFALLHLWLVPGAVEADFAWQIYLYPLTEPWSWSDMLYYVLAVSIVEPFYVCAGFSLYLNRRASLEAWDIELALRRLAQRLTRAAGVAATVLLCSLAAFTPPAEAQTLTPWEAAAEVLKEPDFQAYREETRWVYRGASSAEREGGASDVTWLAKAAQVVAEFAQGVVWVLLGLLVAFLLHVILRRRGSAEGAAAYAPPHALFGLDLRPESLPADIAAAAAECARQGRMREALSLLYRGALSALVHRYQVRLTAGDTEADSLRRAAHVLDSGAERYFARLVQLWTQTAYASRAPHAEEVLSLCREWARHFAAERAV